MALCGARRAVLQHIRVPVNSASLAWCRFMGSGHGHGHGLDKNDVTERVLAVLKDYPKVDPAKVSPTVHFYKDLGLDSLDTVEIVLALEEEFAFEMPDKDAEKIDSVGIAIDYIAAHPAAK